MARRASAAPNGPPSSSYVNANLHPGFVNLGNTCFLNSVLQATSATQSLKLLYHPEDATSSNERGRAAQHAFSSDENLPSELIQQLSLRSRSPVLQLADEEHGRVISRPPSRRPSSSVEPSIAGAMLGRLEEGASEEAERSDASSSRSSMDVKGGYEPIPSDLPLNTAFRQVLEKTWNSEQRKMGSSSNKTSSLKAAAVNPKRLLSLMASKYDQYGEYGQQDGHELLRHLLDSLRMEEVDVIKKIQPPPPPNSKRHHRMSSARNGSAERQEEQMQPFVDSLFCGKLLSCVVCEGCRHVSHTYETFYDMSLSLRPEADAKVAGKRDRMRSMADRWKRATSSKNASPGGGSSGNSTRSATESLAMLTDGLMGSVSDTEEVGEKIKRSASRSGRGVIRPKSAASVQNPAAMDANSRESAKTFMMKSLQPEANPSSDDVDVDRMEKLLVQGEEKKKEGSGQGAVALLRAVSTRSRPPSRGASPMREEINHLVEGEKGAGGHHNRHHLLRHEPKPKQSKQGAYLAKLLVESPLPAPLAPTAALLWGRKTPVPSSNDSFSDVPSKRGGTEGAEMESQQASTGLVRALHQFTSVEVLDGANSFACKRCWRILNPPTREEEEKLRLRRIRRGKDEEESERSSDDEASSDEEEKEQRQREELSQQRPPPSPTPSKPSLTLVESLPGKPKRPPTNPHPDWDKTMTADRVEELQATTLGQAIPSIETTSPQTPVMAEGAAEGDTTSASTPTSAPLLQAPKAVLASSKGINLGGSLSSASSDDGSASGAATTADSSEESDGEKRAKSIKFVDAQAGAESSSGQRQTSKALLRKRSTHSLQRRALKRFLIAETPKVLVFHFKRFQASSRSFSSYSFSNSFKKIDDYVSFPEYLDVKPWLAPPREEYNRNGHLKRSSDPRALAKASMERGAEEQERERRHGRWGWRPRTPGKEMDGGGGEGRAGSEGKTRYRLYAVVVHQGSMSGGHYTAFVLSDRTSDSAGVGSGSTNGAGSTEAVSTVQGGTGGDRSTRLSSEAGLRSSPSFSSLGSESGPGVSDASGSIGGATSAAPDADAGRSSATPAPSDSSAAANEKKFESQSAPRREGKRDNRRWIYASDTVVRPASIEEVLKAQAYMLFYEQLSS